MTIFQIVSLKAAELAANNGDPISSWKEAAEVVIKTSTELRKKSCPKSTFLGLAEEGMIIGVKQGKYTASIDNKKYGIKAIEECKKDPALANKKSKLWELACQDENKEHNQQMDVVIALFNAGLIN